MFCVETSNVLRKQVFRAKTCICTQGVRFSMEHASLSTSPCRLSQRNSCNVKAALNSCQQHLNSRWHSAIKTSPNHLVFGKAKTLALARHFGTMSSEDLAVEAARKVLLKEDELLKDASALNMLDTELNLQPGAFQTECERYMKEYWHWDKQKIVEAFKDEFHIDWDERFPQSEHSQEPAEAVDRPDLQFADDGQVAYVEVDTTDIQLPFKDTTGGTCRLVVVCAGNMLVGGGT